METTIGRYAFCVKAHLPLIFLDDADMDNPSRKVLADNLARLMRLGEPDQMTQALEGLAVSPRQPKNNFKKFLRLRAMRV